MSSPTSLTTEAVDLPGVAPADPPTELLPDRLWHGGCPVDFEWARRTGIEAIVDLADADTYPPVGETQGMVYVKCPLVDEGHLPDPAVTLGLARLVAGMVQQGYRTLVHCTFGRNRSGLLAALVVREVERLSGADAVAHVQARRAGALNNETFAAWLRELPPPE